MSRSCEIEVEGGSLIYQVNDGHIQIEQCHVRESAFKIPDRIENLPVTVILKKAVLSSKILKELWLPEELWEIGDWAFAHCSRLEKVWLPEKNISFGKGVFKDCMGLSRIYFTEREDEKLAGLFAMVPVMLDAEYLLAPKEAGDTAWIEKLDARLVTLLDKPDEEGYLKQVLCGEEDLMASLDIYLANRRKEKASLCFARLLNDTGLGQGLKSVLQKYLRENTKGCEYESAWEIVFKQHGQDKEYYRIFAESGCITEDNFDGLLLDMGESNPEMKAWMLRYKEENRKEEDFFAGLSLDE